MGFNNNFLIVDEMVWVKHIIKDLMGKGIKGYLLKGYYTTYYNAKPLQGCFL